MPSDASADMIPRDVEFRVKVGSRETVQLTLTDEDNCAVSMTCCSVYNGGNWKVWCPTGTLLINGTITYTCRTAGIVSYTLGACDAISANRGQWAGEVETLNCACVISDQSKTFRFVIEESR